MVSDIFQKFIYYFMTGCEQNEDRYQEKILRFQLAMIKSSKLDIHSPRYQLVYKTWKKVFLPHQRNFQDTIELIFYRFHKLPDFEKEMLLNEKYYCQTPLNYASVKTFLSCDLKDKLGIDGTRTRNFRRDRAVL